MLDWHELVNDTLADEPILVSFCPLCGTGMVFDRRVGGKERHFGVSGLLYRADLLMHDRETESLWSRVSAEAVTGPLLGQQLRLLRSRMDRWGHGRRHHPTTTVRSRETSHRRDYAPERRIFDVDAPPEAESIEGFWFARAAFHPEASVFSASSAGE